MNVDTAMGHPAISDWPAPAEAALLRTTFVRLIPACELVAERLYARLFAAHPAVRNLFPSDMAAQREKLVQMLASAIDALGNPEGFRSACQELGLKHISYGALPEHYPAVGDLLLEELANAANPPLTDEEIAVWRRFYNLVAREMLSA